MLIAEDHSDWDKVTEAADSGGLGFDAHLVRRLLPPPHRRHRHGRRQRHGCSSRPGSATTGRWPSSSSPARSGRPSSTRSSTTSPMTRPATPAAPRAPAWSRVNHAPLVGDTREFAEARCRVAFGLSMLSAGTPMFFMGEEIVAQRSYRFDNVSHSKEDLAGERVGAGARMFRFYQDLIRMRRANRPSAPARSTSCTPPTPTASSPSPAGTARARCLLWPA